MVSKWTPRYWAKVKMSDTHTLTIEDKFHNTTEVMNNIRELLSPLVDHWCITIMRGNVVHTVRYVSDNELLKAKDYYE